MKITSSRNKTTYCIDHHSPEIKQKKWKKDIGSHLEDCPPRTFCAQTPPQKQMKEDPTYAKNLSVGPPLTSGPRKWFYTISQMKGEIVKENITYGWALRMVYLDNQWTTWDHRYSQLTGNVAEMADLQGTTWRTEARSDDDFVADDQTVWYLICNLLWSSGGDGCDFEFGQILGYQSTGLWNFK